MENSLKVKGSLIMPRTDPTEHNLVSVLLLQTADVQFQKHNLYVSLEILQIKSFCDVVLKIIIPPPPQGEALSDAFV